jgi:hypothetical protein
MMMMNMNLVSELLLDGDLEEWKSLSMMERNLFSESSLISLSLSLSLLLLSVRLFWIIFSDR